MSLMMETLQEKLYNDQFKKMVKVRCLFKKN